jgi:hypothetical protein
MVGNENMQSSLYGDSTLAQRFLVERERIEDEESVVVIKSIFESKLF